MNEQEARLVKNMKTAIEVMEKGLKWEYGIEGKSEWSAPTTGSPIQQLSEGYDIRIAPAPFDLNAHVTANGFRPLRDGERWHRTDFTADMLPHGWRPLLMGEKATDDECDLSGEGFTKVTLASLAHENHRHLRTCRPLPEPDVLVPLEAKDVRIGSAIKNETLLDNDWEFIQGVNKRGIYIIGNAFISFDKLFNDADKWLIKRPGEQWASCSKKGAP